MIKVIDFSELDNKEQQYITSFFCVSVVFGSCVNFSESWDSEAPKLRKVDRVLQNAHLFVELGLGVCLHLLGDVQLVGQVGGHGRHRRDGRPAESWLRRRMNFVIPRNDFFFSKSGNFCKFLKKFCNFIFSLSLHTILNIKFMFSAVDFVPARGGKE